MLTSGNLTRVGFGLLLCNAALVAAVAVLHHAAAQDTNPSPIDADNASSRVEPPTKDQTSVGSPSAVVDALTDPAPNVPAPVFPTINEPPASSIPSEQTAPGGEGPNAKSPPAAAGSDPILQALRSLIQDPNSGLDVPPIQIAPLTSSANNPDATFESNEKTSKGLATIANRLDEVLAHAAQQKRRLKSLSQLTAAAGALTEEAQSLAEAGQFAAAADLLKRVAQLRATIAELAALPKS